MITILATLNAAVTNVLVNITSQFGLLTLKDRFLKIAQLKEYALLTSNTRLSSQKTTVSHIPNRPECALSYISPPQ